MRSEPALLCASPAMEELLSELRLFLDLLDREYLSAGVRERKLHLSNILHRVLTDREPSSKVETQTGPSAPPQMPLPEIPQPWLPPDSAAPPLPSSSLPEGYYEEAVPLGPGKAPEYITSNYDSDAMSSSYESYDEEDEDGKGQKMRHQWPSEEASMDLVKDARICAFLLRKKRFGQWTKLLCVIKEQKLLCYKSSKDHAPQMELTLSGCSVTHVPKDGKKKKHELRIVHQGADPLVLALQSQEQAEEWLKVMREVCVSGNVDLDGAGSGSPVHRTELEKRTSCDRPSSDVEPTLENGHSDWKDPGKGKKSSKPEQKGGTVGRGAGRTITKIIGLGKKKPSVDEQTSSAEEDVPVCGYLNVLSNNRWRERWCRLRDNQLLLHKDRDDLRGHMASLPLRGCEVNPGLDHKHPFAFRLLRNGQEVAVLEASSSEAMGRWLGVLLAETGCTTDPAALHYDYMDVETTANIVQLAKQSFCFTSRRAVSPNPQLDNPVNGYACPTGTALHYHDVAINGTSLQLQDPCPTAGGRQLGQQRRCEDRDTYENVSSPELAAHSPPEAPPPLSSVGSQGSSREAAKLKGSKGCANGFPWKQKLDPRQQGKGGVASVPSSSEAERCRYGKNRVEADARRLQAQEEALSRRKQELQAQLGQLKKERRELRAALEASSGKRGQASLTERLKKTEEECRRKEEERVNLELELTEVKENLKKAQSGGVTLGLSIQPRSSRSPQSPALLRRPQDSPPFSSCDTSDTESCSQLSTSSLLRRQAGQKGAGSTGRGHVLRKAKEWEQKNGT